MISSFKRNLFAICSTFSPVLMKFSESAKYWNAEKQMCNSVEDVLREHLPEKVFKEISTILQGAETPSIEISEESKRIAMENKFEIAGYKVPCPLEQNRKPRIVRIGAVQNSIQAPTTAPISQQKKALLDHVTKMTMSAIKSGANIICFQEIWCAPFFFCTRERMPWNEFSESAETGETVQVMQEIARKNNVVIVNSIYERDEEKERIWNTCVVIDATGKIIGKSRKNHIPRVGDFNESSYYMEGDQGHPVFETKFGRIACNICYGRHHPLNWMAYGLNGAEIVFNPSATVGTLSEPLWGIEARNAAIANHYYTVAINRVGTEVFPNEFSSGDGKPAHKDFGHFFGSSYVAAPNGSRTPGLSRINDSVLVTEVDLNLCRQACDKWMFRTTARWEMYAQFLADYCKNDFKKQIIKP